MRAGLLLVVTALGGCQCGESLTSLEADIAVEPERIDFARARVLQPTEARLQIGNRGTGRLTLSARVEPDDAGFAVSAPESVGVGLAEDATVSFTPPARALFAAELVITSNDPDTPELRVPLTGEGGPPILTVDPDPIDLGLVNEGVGRERVVRLVNTGFDTLALTGATLRSGAAFALDASALPAALAPDEETAVVVSLYPNAAIAALAVERALEDTLVVTSADGDTEVPVRATVNLAPVAVAVEQVTRRDVVKVGVARAVIADGSDTVDPEGDAFTYAWSLAERPASSTAALVGQGAPTTRVTPDVVGRYVVVLSAVDVHGAVGTADLEILPRDLSVVLTWGPGGAAACLAFTEEQCDAFTADERAQNCCGQSDLDLHVVRPGGALGDYGTCPAGCSAAQCNEVDDANLACRQTGTDCAWANRAPEWGAPGRVDDPRLDIDDVRGAGPEIISVDEPEDGVWRVVAHYCGDRIGEPSLATVRVFEEGLEVFATDPEPMIEGEAWSAVTMTRLNGAWTSFIAGPGLVVSDPTLCQ